MYTVDHHRRTTITYDTDGQTLKSGCDESDAHTMLCNLLYINELEEKLNKRA